MKEQFKSWSPKSTLAISYKVDGVTNRFEANAHELMVQITSIVDQYQAMEIRLTNRQLYYQLVGRDLIPNAIEVYSRICKMLTKMRYAGLLDWDAIEDRGRVPQKHAEWSSVSSLIRSAVYSYRLPRWEGQDYYVELYCEKQAMESILKPVADDWHIYFGYNKGYSSASTMYELAKRVKAQIEEGKEVRLLYLGDHDPSGLDMIRDVRERVEEFLTEGDDPVEPNFEVIQLALTKEQIRQYNPPPNPAKITDPRAAGYLAEHGKKSWELDALTPEALREITEEGILRFLDQDLYDEIVAKEQEQIKALEEFGKTL